jgi:hypothetical protein
VTFSDPRLFAGTQGEVWSAAITSAAPPTCDAVGDGTLCRLPIDHDRARIKLAVALPRRVDLDDAECSYDLSALRDGELLPACSHVPANQVDEDRWRCGAQQPGSRCLDLAEQVRLEVEEGLQRDPAFLLRCPQRGELGLEGDQRMPRLLQAATFCCIRLEGVGLRQSFDDDVGDEGVDPLLLAGDAEFPLWGSRTRHALLTSGDRGSSMGSA